MASPNLNGSYLQQADPQHFPTNATGAPPPNYTAPTAAQPEQQSQSQEVPKDEVGWYFVEQYYTTLNKTPERLNLFYNKKSIMVWGTEGESLPVAHGRSDIAEKIAAHEFKDCKVRVSNVDSQASAMNGIIIQVLGEMSNNGNPNRKFSQTFFLAEQTNGYYVLNDIFRYLKDDDDIEEGEYEYPEEVINEVQEAVAAATEEIIEEIQEMSIKETSSVEIETAEGDKIKVAETIELAPTPATEVEPTVEETPAPVNGSEETANGTEEAIPVPEAEEKVAEAVEEEKEAAPAEPEAPAVEEPAPTPVVEEKPAPPAPVKATPPPPPAPVVPKTWANLVASGSKPATPIARPAAAAAPAAAAPAAAAPVQTSAPAAAAAGSAAPATTAAPAAPASPAVASGGSQWQTADSGRRSRTGAGASAGAAATPGPTNGFVKNVTDAVTEEALRKALTKFGSLKSLDINKTKSCAFIEFDNPAALASAIASPLTIAGSSVVVEERHRQNTPYRGGPSNRGDGRPPSQGGRGFPNRDGRGFDGGRGGGRGGRGGRGGSFGGGRGGVKTAPAGN